MKSFRIGSCFAVVALLIAIPGCPNPCRPGGGEPELTLGTGEFAYEPMPESMDFVYGQQGGYHLLIGLEAVHIAGDGLVSATLSGTLGGEVIATGSPWLQMTCEDDVLHSSGSFLIYDVTPDELDNQMTHLTAELTDLDGNSATAEADVLITAPPPPTTDGE